MDLVGSSTHSVAMRRVYSDRACTQSEPGANFDILEDRPDGDTLVLACHIAKHFSPLEIEEHRSTEYQLHDQVLRLPFHPEVAIILECEVHRYRYSTINSSNMLYLHIRNFSHNNP